MGKHIHKKLHHLYQRHGLFTFALAFIPVIPGFIEHHALAYLQFVQTLTGTSPRVNRAIKTLFGARGLSALDKFLNQTPPLYTNDVKHAFLNTLNPVNGLNIINQLFFDQRQRALPYSDITRSQVIYLLPDIFNAYPSPTDQLIRTQLIQKIALLATLEKAIDPLLAITQVCQNLIDQHLAYQKLKTIHHQNQILSQLESKMKGDLAGHATACDPDFVTLVDGHFQDVQPQLLHQDVTLLVKTLNRLKYSPAPQVALKAHQALYKLALPAY